MSVHSETDGGSHSPLLHNDMTAQAHFDPNMLDDNDDHDLQGDNGHYEPHFESNHQPNFLHHSPSSTPQVGPRPSTPPLPDFSASGGKSWAQITSLNRPAVPTAEEQQASAQKSKPKPKPQQPIIIVKDDTPSPKSKKRKGTVTKEAQPSAASKTENKQETAASTQKSKKKQQQQEQEPEPVQQVQADPTLDESGQPLSKKARRQLKKQQKAAEKSAERAQKKQKQVAQPEPEPESEEEDEEDNPWIEVEAPNEKRLAKTTLESDSKNASEAASTAQSSADSSAKKGKALGGSKKGQGHQFSVLDDLEESWDSQPRFSPAREADLALHQRRSQQQKGRDNRKPAKKAASESNANASNQRANAQRNTVKKAQPAANKKRPAKQNSSSSDLARKIGLVVVPVVLLHIILYSTGMYSKLLAK